MKNITKKIFTIILISILFTSCKNNSENKKETILIAAASSLEYSFKDNIIPMFEKKYPWINVEATYDSSGKLQTQIQEGLNADIFMSASKKQITNLLEQNLLEGNLLEGNSIIELLENEIVLIVPKNSLLEINSFEEIIKAKTIALGDPESVPVGQYSKEALEYLNIWEEVKNKTSFGSNVTEVLNWVGENSADAGIVYKTDATTTDKVKILFEAPKESLKEKVLYPVGLISNSSKKDEANLFLKFLETEEVLQVFRDYGFTINK